MSVDWSGGLAGWYVDQTDGDDGNLGTEASPFQNLQKAIDVASTSDIIVITLGDSAVSEVLTASVVHNLAGAASAVARVIGTNSSWVADGEMYVLDANNVVSTGFSKSTGNYATFENIEIKNATGDGAANGGSDYIHWHNCYFHNNGSEGLNNNSARGTVTNCTFSSNSSYGLQIGAFGNVERCEFYSNSGYAQVYFPSNAQTLRRSVIRDGNIGLYPIGGANVLVEGNVFYNLTTYGANVGSGGTVIQKNKFLDCGSAIRANNLIWGGENYFYDCTEKIDSASSGQYLDIEETDYDASADGVVDAAGDDFSTSEDSERRRVEFRVGAYEINDSKVYVTYGLSASDAGGGGAQRGIFENGIWR